MKGPMMLNGSKVIASTIVIDHASGCCSGESST